MKHRIFIVLAVLAMLAGSASAQIAVPNTLTAGTTITVAPLNTNFSTIANHALDRLSGGNISGNITMDPGITIDGLDLSVALCSTCAATFSTVTAAAATISAVSATTVSASTMSVTTDVTGVALKHVADTTTKFYFPANGQAAIDLTGTQRLVLDGNGLTVYGNNIINNTGKIPALTSTYFTSLDASTLTGIPTVPSGAIFFFNAACPAGYTEFTSARGRVVVGVPNAGTLAGTVGTALTDLQNPTTPINESSNSTSALGALSTTPALVEFRAGTSFTVTTVAAGGDVRDTFMGVAAVTPYIQLRACQKT